MKTIARWETTGKDFLDLKRGHLEGNYVYTGNNCGGAFRAVNDESAIAAMEAPWEHPEGVGQVTVLKADRPSLRRTI